MNKKNILNKLFSAISAIALIVAAIPVSPANAALTSRSVTLGSSAALAVTSHDFDFTIGTTGNVGSIKFEYCTTASGSCTTPGGLVTTSATLTAQTGATGFTIVNGTAGAPYITRTAANVTAPQIVSYTLGSITNPTATNTTFYVRVTTHASTDTTGGTTDAGTVATSTASQIQLSASVDESLTFCTGTSGITSSSCAGATGTAVNLGTLTTTSTGTGTSQIGVSTNAGSGYAITVNGTTLTSGSNTITALATQTASDDGVSQFGLNLRDNTAPNIGADPAGAGTATPTANYNTVDQFRFVTADQVASKASADDFRLFTVSYIANIAGSTAAGTYTSTMTYIATATF